MKGKICQETRNNLNKSGKRAVIRSSQLPDVCLQKSALTAATVSDIAHQAGMSQGNIYWYFSSKGEILKAILIDSFESMDNLVETVEKYPGSAFEKLIFFTDSFLDYGNKAGADIDLIISSLSNRGGIERVAKFGINLGEYGMNFHQSITNLIASAQAEGALEEGHDPSTLAMFFVSFFNGLTFMYREMANAVPNEILRAAVLRLLGAKS